MATVSEREEVSNSFGKLAAEEAMKGAANYIASHKLSSVDLDLVIRGITTIVRSRLNAILDDAKLSIESGLEETATRLFASEMQLCGIDAVKNVAGRT